MLFMVIERFKDRDPIPVYRRVRDPGIKFPDGTDLCRELDRTQFRPLLPADGMSDDLRLLQRVAVLENNRDLGDDRSRSCLVVPSKEYARSRARRSCDKK